MSRAVGLIMSGGRSARMRLGGCATHKALRTVDGAPLLEWNLRALLSAGLSELFIAVSAHEHDIVSWVDQTGRGLAQRHGARLDLLVEREPLGTIGAVGSLPRHVEEVLVVNVDNLTLLDLEALARFHREARAALTIATHTQPLPVPFGVLELNGARVSAYREKPRLSIPISSGTYVLGSEALARVDDGQRLDLPTLVEWLLEAGLPVAAFAHEAPWVDVNDEVALAHARRLFSKNTLTASAP